MQIELFYKKKLEFYIPSLKITRAKWKKIMSIIDELSAKAKAQLQKKIARSDKLRKQLEANEIDIKSIEEVINFCEKKKSETNDVVQKAVTSGQVTKYIADFTMELIGNNISQFCRNTFDKLSVGATFGKQSFETKFRDAEPLYPQSKKQRYAFNSIFWNVAMDFVGEGRAEIVQRRRGRAGNLYKKVA